MVVKCEALKVEWVLKVEAAMVPESWRNPEGWRTLKDYVRDNMERGGQPGKVTILQGKAYIRMSDPVEACMGFNALVGIWWDGWQLIATLSEHRDGLVRVVAGPTNERFGQQIRIESIHYKRQREQATLRRPRNSYSTKNSTSQKSECPDPEYLTMIGPSTLSPYGLIEHYFHIHPGSCPDWCSATISCHSTPNVIAYQIPAGPATTRPDVYKVESACSEESSDSNQGHRRFESSSSNATASSIRNGPIIVKSS